jgi:hypothetical protein
MKLSPKNPRLASPAAALLAIALIALFLAGCGGYGSDRSEGSGSTASTDTSTASGTRLATPVTAADNPTAAMGEFLDAVKNRDAEGFCRLTEPDVQRENFEAAAVPTGEDCVESAAAMFAAKAPNGAEPFWKAIAQAGIGVAEPECKPTDHCKAAVVEVRELPLAGGGTTSAKIPLSYRDGQWRIGPL